MDTSKILSLFLGLFFITSCGAPKHLRLQCTNDKSLGSCEKLCRQYQESCDLNDKLYQQQQAILAEQKREQLKKERLEKERLEKIRLQEEIAREKAEKIRQEKQRLKKIKQDYPQILNELTIRFEKGKAPDFPNISDDLLIRFILSSLLQHDPRVNKTDTQYWAFSKLMWFNDVTFLKDTLESILAYKQDFLRSDAQILLNLAYALKRIGSDSAIYRDILIDCVNLKDKKSTETKVCAQILAEEGHQGAILFLLNIILKKTGFDDIRLRGDYVKSIIIGTDNGKNWRSDHFKQKIMTVINGGLLSKYQQLSRKFSTNEIGLMASFLFYVYRAVVQSAPPTNLIEHAVAGILNDRVMFKRITLLEVAIWYHRLKGFDIKDSQREIVALKKLQSDKGFYAYGYYFLNLIGYKFSKREVRSLELKLKREKDQGNKRLLQLTLLRTLNPNQTFNPCTHVSLTERKKNIQENHKQLLADLKAKKQSHKYLKTDLIWAIISQRFGKRYYDITHTYPNSLRCLL